MEIVAKLRYLNVAPRKVRLVADLIRGKSTQEAETILKFTVKKATLPLLKLLKSAIANARNNFQLEASNFYISKILVDEGPKSKRYMPRARGQGYEIQKKTSHITLVLSEIEKKKKKRAKKAEKLEKIETVAEEKRVEKIEKPKFKPIREKARPKIEKGLKRIFRRKSF